MALCSTPSPPLVILPRRYHPPINPFPAVFFHRAHFSTSLSNFVSTSRDRNGIKPRISFVCASVDPSCTEMNPPSYRIFVKGLSRSTSEGYLLKKFSQFGEINKESTQLAVKEMNGKFVDGRFIAVMMSRPEAPTKHVKFMPYRF